MLHTRTLYDITHTFLFTHTKDIAVHMRLHLNSHGSVFLYACACVHIHTQSFFMNLNGLRLKRAALRRKPKQYSTKGWRIFFVNKILFGGTCLTSVVQISIIFLVCFPAISKVYFMTNH